MKEDPNEVKKAKLCRPAFECLQSDVVGCVSVRYCSKLCRRISSLCSTMTWHIPGSLYSLEKNDLYSDKSAIMKISSSESSIAVHHSNAMIYPGPRAIYLIDHFTIITGVVLSMYIREQF